MKKKKGNKYEFNEIFELHNKSHLYKCSKSPTIIIKNISIEECKFFLKNIVKKEVDNLKIKLKKKKY